MAAAATDAEHNVTRTEADGSFAVGGLYEGKEGVRGRQRVENSARAPNAGFDS